jgi:light-regulated signal transduction histidine kinase (bacteriophytochrome)
VAIVVCRGPEFVIEMANPGYRALVKRELVGRRFEDVLPELSSDVWAAFRRVMETGEPFVANEFYIPYDHNEDGASEDHWFNVVYHPLYEPDGVVSGLVAVCSEVTAQVLARKELERVNSELEEFAFVASHDLQEPLRMIGIYTELLLRRHMGADPAAAEYASFVRQGVERMRLLIHDLLLYSKTIHHEEIATESADLNESLRQALTMVEASVAETGAKITYEPLPTVRGDQSQFVHVFENLLSNSLKYRRPEVVPEIRIRAERSGEQWLISVEDNGTGFEPQYAERIFGLFKRLHKDEFPGTGLGLAICQRIVARYGGRIWAEGRPGSGSTFYIAVAQAT